MKRRAMICAVLLVPVLHLSVLLALPLPVLISNLVQLAPPLLAIVLCAHERRRASDRYFRRLWFQLGFSFFIWLAGQVWFVSSVVRGQTEPVFPSPGDFLWMLYAFPMLLVISDSQDTTEDWAAWIDVGQAGVAIAVLFVLMYSRPALITIDGAYNAQGIALFLAAALRYSAAVGVQEKVFFRNLTLYLLVDFLCAALANRFASYGYPPGSLVDLFWIVPFLVFCLLVIRSGQGTGAAAAAMIRDRQTRRSHAVSNQAGGYQARLQGIGASILTLISIGAGGVLATHRPVLGMLALALAFSLFAARTSLRDLQVRAAQGKLIDASLHDSLTGLANRKLLLLELERCVRKFGDAPAEENFAVLFVDLDRFKIINDSLGHAYGDRVLVAVTEVLRAAIEPLDLLARLGGDEFVILIENVKDQNLPSEYARRILTRLQFPLALDDRVTYLNASIGIAFGSQAGSSDEIVRNADCAMYEAKELGRGRARTFAPAMVRKVNEELQLETDLRETLNGTGISVWYQPIFSVAADRIHGFEALARWKHPRRGIVSPGEFIPVAEDTGLIIELGKQMLRMACVQIRDWNARYRSSYSVSVNVSACQFSDPALLYDILDIIKSTGVDPGCLRLEVTESVLIHGLNSVKHVLEGARAAGVQIYLDDFGTGYSSLSYLLNFPFDVVKLDRSFVHRLGQDVRMTEVVGSIIQLTSNLRKRVIAEGVETAAELACLQHLGCDLVQGYLLSKPLPVELITPLLDRYAAQQAVTSGPHLPMQHLDASPPLAAVIVSR